MANSRRVLSEHDLTLHLVTGAHTSAEAIHFFQSLDDGCATRWLSYFDPTVDMSRIDIASIPEIRHVIAEKQKGLFGQKIKPYAIVCGSDASEQYFFGFWRKYYVGPEVQAGSVRIFRGLDDAFDWLRLSNPARSAATRAIDDWTTDSHPSQLGGAIMRPWASGGSGGRGASFGLRRAPR